MNNLYYDHMFGWNFGGGLMMVIFWVALLFLIIWLVKETNRKNHSDISQPKSALDILKDRYAKGEINKEEFETKKKDLIN
ncbi:MAG: SHOCT domain-containing protein [Patescibacteria group bacterium]|nr:SHOCT domain-containing protein [Patescibacteria group bacterium]